MLGQPSHTPDPTRRYPNHKGLIDAPARGVSMAARTSGFDTDMPPPTAVSSADAPVAKPMLPPLPADDGNRLLRKRIAAIQARDLPAEEKARLMQLLLIEGYAKSKSQLASQNRRHPMRSPPPPSPIIPSSATGRLDLVEPLHPLTAWSSLGGAAAAAAVAAAAAAAAAGPLESPLSDDDLRPTYTPERPEDDTRRPFGCEHYRRNVKMQCATCLRWYTCRFCHDDVEDHVLPRKDTQNMLCMFCGCAQKVSDTCVKCRESAAHYYCGVCKFWNNDPDKLVYHCPDCGLCRVGQGLGRDFFHCHVRTP